MTKPTPIDRPLPALRPRFAPSLALGLSLALGALGGCGAESKGESDTGPGVDVDPGAGEEHEVIVEIPVSDEGVHYDGVGEQEIPEWGVTAFTVSSESILWVADGPRRQLLAYDAHTAERVDEVDLDGIVTRIEDIAVSGERMFVLDSGRAPAVLNYHLGDGTVEIHELPAGMQVSDGLSGISVTADGAVVVELRGGAELFEVLDAEGTPTASELDSYEVAGFGVTVTPGDLTGPNPGHGTIAINGEVVAEVDVTGALASLELIGGWENGTFAVGLQELVVDDDGVIRLDERVRTYNIAGAMLGESRLHSDREVLSVDGRLAVGPDGDVFHMATRSAHVEIQRLSSSPELLEGVLSGQAPRVAPLSGQGMGGDGTGGKPAPAGQTPRNECVSGKEMLDLAYDYATHEQTYTEENVFGACAERKRPAWMTVGTHEGVAYNWGGFDTIQGYADAMANGYQGGDANSGGVFSCSRGVDCSGFVSRVWRASRHTTATLHNIADEIGGGAMITGDAFNKPNNHVRMFVSYEGDNGVMVAEATTGGLDRVVVRYLSWGKMNGYTPRRYDLHCGYFDTEPEPEPEPEPDPPPQDNCPNPCWPEYPLGMSCDADAGIVECGDFDDDGCTELVAVDLCGVEHVCYGDKGQASCCSGAFCDDEGHGFEGDIDYIAGHGITMGCGTGHDGEPLYCPDNEATRGEAVVMLGRATDMPPLAEPDAFEDDNGHFAEHYLNAAFVHGITQGIAPGLFGPDDSATRTHVAAFLARFYDLPAPQGDHFTDDDTAPAWAQTAHNQLFEAGITTGCAPSMFCGDDFATRGQLAAFVGRAHQMLAKPDWN